MNDDQFVTDRPWWETTPLNSMTVEQWESLCDGCAKCCLQKLEDEEDGTVYYTDLACNLLDTETCRCTDYQNRHERVAGCVWLKPEHLGTFYWLPDSCAYRLLAEGRPLPSWHHLISNDRRLIHQLSRSVSGRCQPASSMDESRWDEHVVEWPLEQPE